jgi:SAM-dependent methyltransferase
VRAEAARPAASARPLSPADARAALLDAVVARYAAAGYFAKYWARGKLGRDPIFFALLRRGLLHDGVRLLDLGCGQAILCALLVESRALARAGRWPSEWPPPPDTFALRGIELSGREVRRAHKALGREALVEARDLRDAQLQRADAIALIDVIHYLEPAAQDVLLRRIANALAPGGLFLFRICDMDGGWTARLTRAGDHFATLTKGGLPRRLHGRSAPDWKRALERLGLSVTAEPMSEGTPFANVLFTARKPAAGL